MDIPAQEVAVSFVTRAHHHKLHVSGHALRIRPNQPAWILSQVVVWKYFCLLASTHACTCTRVRHVYIHEYYRCIYDTMCIYVYSIEIEETSFFIQKRLRDNTYWHRVCQDRQGGENPHTKEEDPDTKEYIPAYVESSIRGIFKDLISSSACETTITREHRCRVATGPERLMMQAYRGVRTRCLIAYQGKISSIRSTPFWYASLPMKQIRGTSGRTCTLTTRTRVTCRQRPTRAHLRFRWIVCMHVYIRMYSYIGAYVKTDSQASCYYFTQPSLMQA